VAEADVKVELGATALDAEAEAGRRVRLHPLHLHQLVCPRGDYGRGGEHLRQPLQNEVERVPDRGAAPVEAEPVPLQLVWPPIAVELCAQPEVSRNQVRLELLEGHAALQQPLEGMALLVREFVWGSGDRRACGDG